MNKLRRFNLKNPEHEEGRICSLQPNQKYIPFALSFLKFMLAMCKRVNKVMRDTFEETNHMDMCQGKALFEVLSGHNLNSVRGRNEVYKLLFDRKNGAIGGIYEDMCKLDVIYPNELSIFGKGLRQLHGYEFFGDQRPQTAF